MEVTPATEDDVPALSELLGVLFQQEAEFRPDPELQSAGLRAILGRADVGPGRGCWRLLPSSRGRPGACESRF